MNSHGATVTGTVPPPGNGGVGKKARFPLRPGPERLQSVERVNFFWVQISACLQMPLRKASDQHPTKEGRTAK